HTTGGRDIAGACGPTGPCRWRHAADFGSWLGKLHHPVEHRRPRAELTVATEVAIVPHADEGTAHVPHPIAVHLHGAHHIVGFQAHPFDERTVHHREGMDHQVRGTLLL